MPPPGQGDLGQNLLSNLLHHLSTLPDSAQFPPSGRTWNISESSLLKTSYPPSHQLLNLPPTVHFSLPGSTLCSRHVGLGQKPTYCQVGWQPSSLWEEVLCRETERYESRHYFLLEREKGPVVCIEKHWYHCTCRCRQNYHLWKDVVLFWCISAPWR